MPSGVPTAPPTATSSTTPQTGVLEVRVTDQPSRDVEPILVTADLVEVNRRDEEGAQGWVTAVDEEVSFDLLEVTVIEMTLGSAEL